MHSMSNTTGVLPACAKTGVVKNLSSLPHQEQGPSASIRLQQLMSQVHVRDIERNVLLASEGIRS